VNEPATPSRASTVAHDVLGVSGAGAALLPALRQRWLAGLDRV
jgi:hypothetical protein